MLTQICVAHAAIFNTNISYHVTFQFQLILVLGKCMILYSISIRLLSLALDYFSRDRIRCICVKGLSQYRKFVRNSSWPFSWWRHGMETRSALLVVAWWRHQMGTFSVLMALVRGIHRSPVNSPHKSQWRGALMFSLICLDQIEQSWASNRDAGDLRRHHVHYGVAVMVRGIHRWPHKGSMMRRFDVFFEWAFVLNKEADNLRFGAL